ncbi:Peptidase family M23 [Micromonospora inyonensis]|uniref:Peptidase family M23 n=1 Tax=Micromonospora inyonensis TaxID=47866 RepID=A0A1C6RT96_9ACTN|nr:Peptidase family M23 [Micromonospora inyonensis]
MTRWPRAWTRALPVAPLVALTLAVVQGSSGASVELAGHGAHTVGPAPAAGKPVAPPVPAPPRPFPGQGFRWPLDDPSPPVRDFDPPPRPWLPGHRGVDLPAPADAPVRAAGAGVVLFAGMVAGRPVITVGHTGGLRTTYEPVRPSVRVGTRVVAGTPLGELSPGHAGCPVPACLHWGLRRGEDYLDPFALLGPVPVRLLPRVDPPVPGSVVPVTRRFRRSLVPATRRPGVSVVPATCRSGPVGAGPGQRWASRGGRRTARRSYSSALL